MNDPSVIDLTDPNPSQSPSPSEPSFAEHKLAVQRKFDSAASTDPRVEYFHNFLRNQYEILAPDSHSDADSASPAAFDSVMCASTKRKEIIQPYARLLFNKDYTLSLAFTMALTARKGDWVVPHIHRHLEGKDLKGWLRDLKPKSKGHDLLVVADDPPPIVAMLQRAMASVFSLCSQSESSKSAQWEVLIKQAVERELCGSVLRFKTVTDSRAAPLKSIVLGGTANLTILLRDPQYPLRPDAAVAWIDPDAPDTAEIHGHRVYIDLAQTALTFGWDDETHRQVRAVLQRILYSSAEEWDKLVFKYFLVPDYDLLLPVQLNHNRAYLAISVQSRIWKRFGNRRTQVPHKLHLKGVPVPDIKELIAQANQLFVETDDPQYTLQVIALRIKEHWEPPRLPATTQCTSRQVHLDDVLHRCRCGVVRPCEQMTLYASYSTVCPDCVLLGLPFQPVYLRSPFQYSIGRGAKTPDSDPVDVLKASPHLQPAGLPRYAELWLALRSGDEALLLDQGVDRVVREVGYTLRCKPQTRRDPYCRPVRCYLIDTITPTPQPLELTWPSKTVFQRPVEQYRDAYFKTDSFLVDSTLEPRPLRPSLERVRLVDADGRFGHTELNTIVTSQGANLAKNAQHPVVLQFLAVWRTIRACRSKTTESGHEATQELWVKLVDELEVASDKIVDLMRQIPFHGARRKEVSGAEADRIYAEAELIVQRLGLSDIPLDTALDVPLETAPDTAVDTLADMVADTVADPALDTSRISPIVPSVGLKTRRVFAKVKQSVEAAKADPTLQLEWASYNPKAGTRYCGSDLDEPSSDVGDVKEARFLPKEEDFLEFCRVDVDALQRVLPALKAVAKEALTNPKSRFYGAFVWSESFLDRILKTGSLILPWGATFVEQIQAKLYLMEHLGLICDETTGWEWRLIIYLETFIVHNIFFRLMSQDRCHLLGTRFKPNTKNVEDTRNPLHLSEGHIVHGLPMMHAFQAAGWRSLSEDGLQGLDFNKVNTIPESWLGNIYRHDWSSDELECWDKYVLHQGILCIDRLALKRSGLLELWSDGVREECLTILGNYSLPSDLRYLTLPTAEHCTLTA
ncbi:hypothetical protein DFH06DRAFT_1260672 [Mycena polygramma]|nr:hypothetical protein DFH06DRAFT_1260672 [Mycena polygramma]